MISAASLTSIFQPPVPPHSPFTVVFVASPPEAQGCSLTSQKLLIMSSVLFHPALGQVKVRLNTTNLRKVSFIRTQTHLVMGLQPTNSFYKNGLLCYIFARKESRPYHV